MDCCAKQGIFREIWRICRRHLYSEEQFLDSTGANHRAKDEAEEIAKGQCAFEKFGFYKKPLKIFTWTHDCIHNHVLHGTTWYFFVFT